MRLATATSSRAMLTVLIADPHPVMAAVIAELLAREPQTRVVAQATDRRTAARMLGRHRPDVLLLDPALLGRARPAALPLLQQASPATRIVLIAMDDSEMWTREIERCCAVGYIAKSSPAAALGPAIASAARRAPAQMR
jgi:DNA-binding NarL/FixJ family response regulator